MTERWGDRARLNFDRGSNTNLYMREHFAQLYTHVHTHTYMPVKNGTNGAVCSQWTAHVGFRLHLRCHRWGLCEGYTALSTLALQLSMILWLIQHKMCF